MLTSLLPSAETGASRPGWAASVPPLPARYEAQALWAGEPNASVAAVAAYQTILVNQGVLNLPKICLNLNLSKFV